MKIKLALTTAAIAGLALLGACGERPVVGTVTHKQYSAPYTYYTHPCMMWTRTRVGSGSSATTISTCVLYGNVPNHMPASYQICVDGTDKNGNKASGCWEVPPQEYAQWHEGDHYGKAPVQ